MRETQDPYKADGAVIIGRNEGERLRICLESVTSKIRHTVYVDSGSSDNSIDLAKGFGIEVVELDMSVPFTAARARNAGFERLIQQVPDIRFIQFTDGDCEIDPEWFPVATDFLDRHEDVAAVCGRQRERFPERSVYNMLCDIEWDAPIGNVKYCGGNAMMRIQAFKQVGGFRSDLIAGEEPELCVRLRQADWKIWRLENDMALHDAEMTSFFQWWKRAVRSGYAFAQGACLHGGPPEYQNVRESFRIWIWAVGVPIVTVLALTILGAPGWLFLLLYPLQMIRIIFKSGFTRNCTLNALFLVIGKFPEMWGQLKFYLNRIMRVKARLIEYK